METEKQPKLNNEELDWVIAVVENDAKKRGDNWKGVWGSKKLVDSIVKKCYQLRQDK